MSPSRRLVIFLAAGLGCSGTALHPDTGAAGAGGRHTDAGGAGAGGSPDASVESVADADAERFACFPLFHACTTDDQCCGPNRCLVITGTPLCQQEGPAPSSVTLRLVLPEDRPYCDRCAGRSHVTILDDTGRAIETTGSPGCTTKCSTCTASSCPAIPCIPQALPVENDLTWDGMTTAPSICGAGVACSVPALARAGSYVAHMCATPGTFTAADASFGGTCTATGPEACVDVPFTFPGAVVVTGRLP